MPTPPPIVCEHELRPGVTVCLHCLHKARVAAAARRRRQAARWGSVVLAVGMVAAVVVPLLRRAMHEPAGDAAPPAVVREAAMRLTEASDAPGTAPATAPAPRSAPAPIVAEGRTELHDGIVAVRTGDTVAVHFDTPLTRTRRPEKFERIVRATLPEVFGPAADSALAATPAGDIAHAGDLLTELPVRGVHLRTGDGDTLALWPETRPGRDGPLVVTYRVAVVR